MVNLFLIGMKNLKAFWTEWKCNYNTSKNLEMQLKQYLEENCLGTLSIWLCRSQQNMKNSQRDGNTRPPDLPPEKSVCRSRSKLELDVEQQTGSKSGKEYVKVVYCHPAYLTYMQSTSCEMPGWMNHKLESRLPGEISITSDMQMTPPLWQKAKKN